MNVDVLVQEYPTLWHMADLRNLEGILQRGLLSTSQLLDLYRVTGVRRRQIEVEHRRDTVSVDAAGLPICYIRDQRPMSLSRIASTLEDATPQEFFRFLNRHIFFWPSLSRLARMNAAPAYRDMPQLVLVIDSSSLIRKYNRVIRLSPINSGCTTPYAAPRSIAMFQKISDFDWAARKRKKSERVAEITVPKAVPDIWNYVTGVELWQHGAPIKVFKRPYDESLLHRTRRLGRS